MKGGIGWKLITLALDATHESYDVPILRHWFTTVPNLYEN